MQKMTTGWTSVAGVPGACPPPTEPLRHSPQVLTAAQVRTLGGPFQNLNSSLI